MTERRITPIPYSTLVKIFELDGFAVSRQKGDHVVLTKPRVKRLVFLKKSSKEVPVSHILTNLTNLRTAGISRERYFQLLDRVK